MSNVIDALKRLERAGAEDSRATQKLVQAAATLSEHIAAGLPADAGLSANSYGDQVFPLPRHYARTGGDRPYLVRYDGEDYATPVAPDRATALAFARDIATGWLDELAAWLEARTAEAEQSAATLDAARQQG